MDHPTAWGTVWSVVALLGFLAGCYIWGIVIIGSRPMPSPSDPYPDNCDQVDCSDFCYYIDVCPHVVKE